jgi:uncharacterized protein YkwD
MANRAFALLGAAAFVAALSGCSAQQSPTAVACGTSAPATCDIDAKKICEANVDLQSPINGFADTQSQREQNLRPTWPWMQTLNTPSGTEIGISCEMNVQHHRVIYASVARGQALTSKDADYLQSQGLCLNAPAPATNEAACTPSGASPAGEASNGAGGSPSTTAATARGRLPGIGGTTTSSGPETLALLTRPSVQSPESAAASEPEWLDRLNAYRRATGLRPVTEDRAESDGDLKHARYLVKNFKPGTNPGAGAHIEDEKNQWFTREGAQAGRTSDVIPPAHLFLDDATAIDDWLSVPFHALPMLDPDLAQAGFGRYCENGVCAAVLNVGRGGKWLHSQKLVMKTVTDESGDEKYELTHESRNFNRPIEFPPPGSVISGGVFNGLEWPDPLSACPGYTAPTGTVALFSFGTEMEPNITGASISTGGQQLDSCLITPASYKNPDPVQTKAAKGNLTLYGAALLIPRAPLEPGRTYDVEFTKDQTEYHWSFKIEPKGLIVSQ